MARYRDLLKALGETPEHKSNELCLRDFARSLGYDRALRKPQGIIPDVYRGSTSTGNRSRFIGDAKATEKPTIEVKKRLKEYFARLDLYRTLGFIDDFCFALAINRKQDLQRWRIFFTELEAEFEYNKQLPCYDFYREDCHILYLWFCSSH